MTLARTAQAQTPAVAIARILRGIGLKQGKGKDFRVTGNYRTVRVGGRKETERTGTSVLLLTRDADETVAKHADLIEDAVRKDGGWNFRVSVRYFGSDRPVCSVSNEGPRVRQTPPSPAADQQETPAAGEPQDVPVDEPVYGAKGAELGAALRESLRAGLGEHLASTLSIGDRYMAKGQEVTVAYTWPNVDDTFTVHHQTADALSDMRFHPRSTVQVTHRAPRCACGKPWDECDLCDEKGWPEAIEDAYMGRLPARS
jgi:hypothetical protein